MKKKTLLLTSLSVLLCGSIVAGGISFTNAINKANAKLGDIYPDTPMKEFYYQNEELILPSGSMDSDSGIIAISSSYLIYPNGQTISQEKYSLSQIGQYTAVFLGTRKNQTYTSEYKFNVYQKSYEVKNDESYVKYVDHIKCKSMDINSNPGGLEVGLSEGDEVTINKVYNIANNVYSPECDPIIKFYFYSNSELALYHGGVESLGFEAHNYVVKIADYYNPANYISVQVAYFLTNPSTGRQGIFATAGGANQTLSGLEETKNTNVVIDGTGYKLHKGSNEFGANLSVTPGSKSIIDGSRFDPDLHNTDRFGIAIQYDNVSKRIYIDDNSSHLVTDLDDSSIYPAGGFDGFSTGDVIISLSANNYDTKKAHIEIESICGETGEDLNVNRIEDQLVPEIELANDTDNFYIAKDEPFRIFDAYSHDLNSVGEVKASVVYEKGSSYQSDVRLDGEYFTPRKTGNYTITYVAKDAFGNVGTKEVNCFCITATDNHIVNFETLEIDDFDAGSNVYLPKFKISSPNGNEYCVVKAVFEDGSETDIDPNGLSFFAKRVGTYDIVYYYGDSVMDYRYSYTVNSKPSNNVYINNVNLPKYLIKDSFNTFDDVKIVTCLDSQQEEVDPVIYESINHGAYSSTPIDYSAYEVKGENCVQFKYTYKDEVIYESEPIEIVDVGFTSTLRMGDYFVGEDLSYDASSSNITFHDATNEGSSNISFINALSMNKFNLDLTFETKLFGAFDVIISDYYNPQNRSVISFIYNGSSLYVCIDNGTPKEIGAYDNYQFKYDPTQGGFVDKYFNILPYDISKFSKDKIYLDFMYRDIKGPNDLVINAIGNQKMTSRKNDNMTPEIVCDNITGYYNINSVITAEPGFVYDVLSPFYAENFIFTVTLDGNPINSIDGELLDNPSDKSVPYSFMVEEYGQYQVKYQYGDQAHTTKGELSSNVNAIISFLDVEDRECPTITIDGIDESKMDEGAFDTFINVRGYTVNDNSDKPEDLIVRVFIQSPYFEILDITDNMGFIPMYYGVYTVFYYVYDMKGNMSYASYQIKVK